MQLWPCETLLHQEYLLPLASDSLWLDAMNCEFPSLFPAMKIVFIAISLDKRNVKAKIVNIFLSICLKICFVCLKESSH